MFNKKRKVDKRLVKTIRAHFFLKWIKNQFPELTIIFLLRHPFAVAESRLKLGFDNHLDEIFDQPEFLTDFKIPFSKKEIEQKTPFEQQVFLWCVENKLVIQQFSEGEIYLVFYENLCKEPAETIRQLFQYLEKNNNESDNLEWSKQSKSVKTKNVEFDSSAYKLEKANALEILKRFQLDRIYNQSPNPLIKNNLWPIISSR